MYKSFNNKDENNFILNKQLKCKSHSICHFIGQQKFQDKDRLTTVQLITKGGGEKLLWCLSILTAWVVMWYDVYGRPNHENSFPKYVWYKCKYIVLCLWF